MIPVKPRKHAQDSQSNQLQQEQAGAKPALAVNISLAATIKKVVSLMISLALLVVIYRQIDLVSLLDVFQQCNLLWLSLSLAMMLLLIVIPAWRLQRLTPTQQSIGLVEAIRLILVAGTLNMVLPSNMGQIVKAYFLADRGNLRQSLAFTVVIFEKACDLLALLLWCAFGLILYPQKGQTFWLLAGVVLLCSGVGFLLLGSRSAANFLLSRIRAISPHPIRQKVKNFQRSWNHMHDYFWPNRRQVGVIAAVSILLWLLHLCQIWLFILALNAWTPFVTSLALTPLAILVGLLPLTFAGIGTRDAALILFYQPFLMPATGAALGLLCTLRYLLPALGGLPLIGHYIASMGRSRSTISPSSQQ
ncbi:hypothetical protein XM38_014100 [Halomicronema hongdechloris C2206]|uniref:Flippase-like domain-containing protein n=1 Tax=Halomicronema hongdechloris C2206 TaxID=1641165 RepID=A0A1Z3HJJ5_9CYAN|nr:lysylphosphatidylglycerol synthase transmembrane domain-containing protein [Halomicronema hongdechloris]ASC70471.1 hypothetical protein XM38_014100 [Halomicronema hongdechloris C2206]